MQTIAIIFIFLLSLGIVSAYFFIWRSPETVVSPSVIKDKDIIELPEPKHFSEVSVEEAILKRRSTRKYVDKPLTSQEVSQLLWAAQGITDPKGLRTAPSAGALYPLEIYIVVGDVENLDEGIYKYEPHEHRLVKTLNGERRAELTKAALDQVWVKEAAIDIVITAVYERTTVKYGDRGIKYVHIEVGHAAQNLCLQATSLELGIVTVGAFHDKQVKEVMGLPENEQPLYIIPVGKK